MKKKIMLIVLSVLALAACDGSEASGSSASSDSSSSVSTSSQTSQNNETLFDSLRGSVIFEGTRTEKDYITNTDTISEVRTTFDSNTMSVLTEQYTDGIPDRVWLYQESEDGKSNKITHDNKGKVIKEKVDFPFEQQFNPFNLMEDNEFVKSNNNEWVIKDDEDHKKAYDLINVLLGYVDEVESFVMYEENNKITSLEFSFERNTYDFGGYAEDSQMFFKLNVLEHGTASIDVEYFKDYTLTTGHETLKNALETASNANSYTVKAIGDSLQYTLYYTPNGIYVDDGESKFGYIERPDGNIWSFEYDETKKTYVFDKIQAENKKLNYYKGYFTLADNQGEYYILLKNDGNGKFSARSIDVFESYNQLASFFALQMATSPFEIDTFYGAGSFSLSLNGEVLSSVDLDIEDLGHLTLTYENWNKTTFPIQIPENVVAGLIDSSYSGTWVSDNGDTKVKINLDSIMVFDEASDDFVKVENIIKNDNGYTYTFNNKTYSITKSQNTLSLAVDGNTSTLYKCSWYNYIGVFLGVDSDGNDIDITITASEIKVLRENSAEIKAANIVFEQIDVTDDDGYLQTIDQFTFNLNNDKYVLQQSSYGYDILVLAKGDEKEGIGLYRDKYEELSDWSKYVGKYKGQGYELTIDKDKLSLKQGDDTTDIEVVFYKDWDYSSNSYYYQFKFTYKEKQCVIQIMDNAMYLVLDADKDDYSGYYLMNESYTIDFKDFYGDYSGQSYTTTDMYLLSVGENKISLTIGEGNKMVAEILYFTLGESWDGNYAYFILQIDSKIYYLSIYSTSATLQVGEDYIFLMPVVS